MSPAAPRARRARGATVRAAIALVLGLSVAAGLLWLAAMADETPREPTASRVVESSAVTPDDAPALPAGNARAAAPTPVVGGGPEPIEVSPERQAWLGVGRAEEWTGRIVDRAGQPVPGARVTMVPDGITLAALGHELSTPPYYSDVILSDQRWRVEGVGLGRLPTTTSADDGRFRLTGPRAESGDPDQWTPLDESLLLVRHADFETRLAEVAAFEGPQTDLGDVALVGPGVDVIGRLVDMASRPVAGGRVRVESLSDSRDSWTPLAGQAEPDAEGYHVGGMWLGAAYDVVSDAQGRFRLEGLPPLRVGIEFLVDGCLPDDIRVDLEHDVVHDLGDVLLRSGGRIEGVVRDQAGAGIADAAVYAAAWERDTPGVHFSYTFVEGDDSILLQLGIQYRETTHAARTDADGRSRFDRLEFHDQALYVDAAGFEPRCRRDVWPGLADGPTQVAFDLVPESVVELRLTDGLTGRAVEDAVVAAWRLPDVPEADDPDDSYDKFYEVELEVAAVAGQPGAWRFTRAGRLATRLSVTAPGYADVRRVLPGLDPGRDELLPLTLTPEVRVSGTVRDLAGAPIENADVLFYPGARTAGALTAATSDADGSYSTTGLPPGEYHVTCHDWSYAGVVLESLTLVAGGHLEHLDFELAPKATLSGSLLRADGSPRAGGQLLFTQVLPGGVPLSSWEYDLNPPQVHARSDQTGAFSVSVVAGHYQVTGPHLAPRDIVVEAAATPTLELREEPYAQPWVAGTVRLADQPLEGVTVQAWRPGRTTVTAVTDAEGRFRMQLGEAGSYKFTPIPPTPRANLTWPGVAVVEVGAHGLEALELAVDWARLSGRVRDPAGTPMPGLALDLMKGDGRYSVSRAVTDAAGRYDFGWLLPEGYRPVPAPAPEARLACADAAVVTLAAGEVVADHDIQLVAGACIRGRVFDLAGQPARDGGRVRFRTEGQAGSQRSCVITGGAFLITNVPPGRHLLAAFDKGLGWVFDTTAPEVAVSVAEGLDVTLDLRLSP